MVGSGDAIPALKESVRARGLESKVIFVGRVPYAQLLQYTAAADVGLSLDKDTNINYRFSLPNKLFDYLHCGIPVVTSPLVEVARIVEGYGVGATVEPTDIEALRKTMVQVVEQRQHYTKGIERAHLICCLICKKSTCLNACSRITLSNEDTYTYTDKSTSSLKKNNCTELSRKKMIIIRIKDAMANNGITLTSTCFFWQVPLYTAV